MLIVMNGGQKGNVSIVLDKEKLKRAGVEKLTFVNAETGKSPSVEGNKITLQLAAHDYAILWNI